jgi:hypothetical protein
MLIDIHSEGRSACRGEVTDNSGASDRRRDKPIVEPPMDANPWMIGLITKQ